MQTRVGCVLAAAFLLFLNRALGEHPKVNANGTEEETTETEAGGDQAAELAKQLQNPVASLISVPFQNNFDFNLGPNGDGFRYTLNFQPVVPFSLTQDYNIIVRTIVPIISQDDAPSNPLR